MRSVVDNSVLGFVLAHYDGLVHNLLVIHRALPFNAVRSTNHYICLKAHTNITVMKTTSIKLHRKNTFRTFACAILVLSSLAENPPKTTEWMAPMRQQASIATTASGIMGM